jgi:PAS domain S-box-containing protein
MKPQKRNPWLREEGRQVWTVVGIALTLTAYRISVEFVDELREAFLPYTTLPVAEAVTNGLFLWLLALLFVVFRQWRQSIIRRRALEGVISSISPDVLIVVMPDRHISMCNAGVKAMFGYETSEVIGQTTDLLYFDRRIGNNPSEIHDSLQRIGFHIGTARGRRRDGEEFPLEIITGNLRGGPGAVVLLRDITERKRMEEQLVRARDDAQQANQAKSRALTQLEENYRKLKELEQLRDNLTYMIIHDLKSPLSTVGGLLVLLEEDLAAQLNADQHTYLTECASLIRRLQSMTLSVLDVGRMEQGKLPIALAPCNLENLVLEAERMVRMDLRKATVTLVPASQPLVAACDQDLIRRVLVNLLDNALKFTPAGGEVRVLLGRTGGFATVEVVDAGPGIPAQYQQRVFDRFAVIEAKRCSTGLGLTFCKLAVEAHGGRISIESPASLWKNEKPNAIGTAIRFTLPLLGGGPTP